MSFELELERVLPHDVPHRARLVSLCARHLEQIELTNKVMNLTRIVNAQEAAIKHVFDALHPWRYFASAKSVLDAGTGPGFPGIPLAIALPGVKFVLAESVHKKARFVESLVERLELHNVEVRAERAEDVLRSNRIEIVTARAVAPLVRAIPLLAAAIKQGTTALLYKGPDAAAEIEEAQSEIVKRRLRARVLERYRLPEEFGERTLVEVTKR